MLQKDLPHEKTKQAAKLFPLIPLFKAKNIYYIIASES
jgi:hypothetical protein